MKRDHYSLINKGLIVAGLAATLGVTACGRHDGQMSSSEAAAAPKESASLGAVFDDTATTARIKQRLASDARTQSAQISVETNNGVVTLTGSAPDQETKDAAEELARNVAEVQGIDNRIDAPTALEQVSSAAGQAADNTSVAVTDAMITTKVKARFAADEQVKATAINVDTDEGVVTLKGKVASAAARDHAVDLARDVEGVKDVRMDNLLIASR